MSLHQPLPPLSTPMLHLPQALKMALARTDGSCVARVTEVDVVLQIMFVELAALLQSVVLRTSQSSNQAVLKR